MKSRLTAFLDVAYENQKGQFYPERHIENLDRLAEKFPEYDEDLRDCLYRIAIHLDECASDFAGRILDCSMSKEESLSRLAVTFKSFSESTRSWALEDAVIRKAGKEPG